MKYVSLISSLVIIISITSCVKRRDHYSIQKITIQCIEKKNRDIRSWTRDDDDSSSKGIRIVFSKKYISDSHSESDFFLFNNKEAGVYGIKDRVYFEIFYPGTKMDLSPYLYCDLPGSPYRVSLKELIDDINSNQPYTSGLRLNDESLIFLFSDSINTSTQKSFVIHSNVKSIVIVRKYVEEGMN